MGKVEEQYRKLLRELYDHIIEYEMDFDTYDRGTEYFCNMCGSYTDKGHHRDCERGLLIERVAKALVGDNNGQKKGSQKEN